MEMAFSVVNRKVVYECLIRFVLIRRAYFVVAGWRRGGVVVAANFT